MGRPLVVVSCLVLLWSGASPARSGPTSRPAKSGAKTTGRTGADRLRAGTNPEPRPSGRVPAESELERRLRVLRATAVPNKMLGRTEPTAPPASSEKRPATSRPAGAATTRPAATTQPGSRAAPKGAGVDSADALARLRKSVAVSEIPDLQALADALYLAGRRKAATVLYERIIEGATRNAKDAKDAKHVKGAEDAKGAANDTRKAWALYQLGNCYKSTDPDKAAGCFRRVQKEHGEFRIDKLPVSEWSIPAKVQADLIQWQQRNKPAKLIRQSSIEFESTPSG